MPEALRSLTALLPKQHIFLLSHMRAYTSLFGHIMGSNPAICGYYEMHIGYHSWKSLLRQKLLYFRNESVKPGFSCMFDKVLHDDHTVATGVLNHTNSRAIFSLRHPRETIPSILKLYASVDPDHEFNSSSFATDYYVQRLETLQSLAKAMSRPFFYLDAESLVNDTVPCLDSLSHWLELATPLSPRYSTQKKTSQKRYGDSSGKLDTGQIIHSDPDPARATPQGEEMARAYSAYLQARQTLIDLCECHSLDNSRGEVSSPSH